MSTSINRALVALIVGASTLCGSTGLAWAWGCQCDQGEFDDVAVPMEGIIALPLDSCPSESRSIYVTDAESQGVAGGIDWTLSQEENPTGLYWRADAPPLEPGETYRFHSVVKNGAAGFGSHGCEVSATFSTRDDAFPEMTAPEITLSAFWARWIPEFGCYAPVFRVEVSAGVDPATARYERYTLSVLHGGDPTVVSQGSPGQDGGVFNHHSDWSNGWQDGLPFQDAYCVRVEGWEVVNGTSVSADACVTAEDLIGADTYYGDPEDVIGPDSVICDASIDITQPPTIDPGPANPDDAPSGCGQSGGRGGALPALLGAMLFALCWPTRRRRRSRCNHSPPRR